ncbi:MAG: hypothetical protein ACTSPY_03725 [Candidatus Helarchaeota archaeon]
MESKYNYKISEEFFTTIENEFNGETIAKEYLKTKDPSVFEIWGKKWMERTYELGLKPENIDRTYEIIKIAAEKTGQLLFPHEAQRFIELAYLSVHLMSGVNIYTATVDELSFKVMEGECTIYETLKNEIDLNNEVELPCKNACITAIKTLFDLLKMDVEVSILNEMQKDGFCLFCSKKKK